MKPGSRRRLWHWSYYLLGSAAGGYVIYLLAAELGAVMDRGDFALAAPASLMVIAWFIVPLLAAAQSWRLLFPGGGEPAAPWSARLTWIGLSVNWLLPAALVGGELVKFRLALGRASSTADLVASLVGDKTIQVATQLAYTLAGVSILAAAGTADLGGAIEVAGFALFCGAVYGFYRLQRTGLFAGTAARLKALTTDRERLALTAARIDAAIDGMYRRAGRWWRAVVWRCVFRLAMAVEVALGLWWLGEPAGLAAVLAIESVAQASRVAALVVPAALGAQEAAILGSGLILGYPAEALIVLAVVKRVREIVVGGSGLIAWHAWETRRLQ